MPSLLLERERESEWNCENWEFPLFLKSKREKKNIRSFFLFGSLFQSWAYPQHKFSLFLWEFTLKFCLFLGKIKKKHRVPDSPGTELKSFSFRSVSERDKDSLHPALQFLADGAFCNLMWERSNCYCRHCSSFFCLRF